jgi:hypothetical protein
MFQRILTVAGESRAEKYASTYQGKKPTDLASINEAAMLADLLDTASPTYRNGLSLPTPRIIATGVTMGKTEFDWLDMIRDGYFSPEERERYRPVFDNLTLGFEVRDGAGALVARCVTLLWSWSSSIRRASRAEGTRSLRIRRGRESSKRRSRLPRRLTS